MVSETQTNLTVAVTGVTGTLGLGLMPLLEADDRVAHVTGVARHPFDPAAHGWTKTKYLRGDVRDAEMLREAFRHADVVVHLAFQVTGAVPGESIESVNIGGTLNAFDAAAAVGARRFVFASSVAAYGFHRDNPIGMTEDWPTRPAARLFYGQEKARLEHLLQARATHGRRPRPVPAAPVHRARAPCRRREEPPSRPSWHTGARPGAVGQPDAVPGSGSGVAGATRARSGRGAGAVAVRRRRRSAGYLQHRG